MKNFASHTDFLDAMFDILYFGNGIDDLLSLAESALGSPVFLYDVSYNIIGMSPAAKKQTARLEKADNMFFLNSSEIRRMQKYNVLEEIDKHTSAYIAKDSDEENIYWLLCSVRIKQTFSGYMISVYDHEPEKDLPDLMTAISRAVAIELQKSNLFTSSTGLKYQYFMTNLIEGRFRNEETILSRLNVLNKKLAGNYYIACVTAVDRASDLETNEAVSEKLRRTFPVSMSIFYQNMLVILFSSEEILSSESALMVTFQKNLHLYHFKAAISQRYSSLLDTSSYFAQVRNALSFGKITDPEETIYFTEDYLLYHLLSKINESNFSDLRLHIHEEIKNYDIKHGTEYLSTIRTFLKNNRNSVKAAEEMHLHRTTFFYRIKRIEELWPISFSDSNDLFLMELFCRIDDYKSLRQNET